MNALNIQKHESARNVEDMTIDELNEKIREYMTRVVSLSQGDPDKLARSLSLLLTVQKQRCEELGSTDYTREYLEAFMQACEEHLESDGRPAKATLLKCDIRGLFMINIHFGERTIIQLYEGCQEDWLNLSAS